MTTLFFVHGFWTTPRIWEQYQAYFGQLGYRTLAPALPQHFTRNQAQHPENLSLQDYLDCIEEDYLAAAQSGDEMIIVGHGMGAILAMQLAMRVDPQALVLIAPDAPSSLGSAFPPTRALVEACAKPFFWKRGIKPSLNTK